MKLSKHPRPTLLRRSICVPAGRRRGAAAVLGLALLLSLVVLMAVCMDYGFITVSQAELSRTADASAMAGAWEMYDQVADGDTGSEQAVHNAASDAAYENHIAGDAPSIIGDDVELGIYDLAQGGVFTPSHMGPANAVRVTLRRQNMVNGELPLFFGALTGRDTQSLNAKATAAMLTAISGFNEPSNPSLTVNIFPFALDEPTWNDVVAGIGPDNYNFNGSSVQSGGDGIVECNLYPKDTGAPGNRGTVDIGGANNSTNDLSRQILHGVSKQDFIDLGHPLEFDSNGELELNGDTGISAGVKDEIASIIGQKRIIPIFSSVSGNGNNA
ncbi:MAG: hypothetical protein HKN47_08945, partial [Pirellulaceae bacterium]|nr:hypothetical protein [Pirellulaceae bacterium]